MAEADAITDVVADPSATSAAGSDAQLPDSSTGETAVTDGSAASSAEGGQDQPKSELEAVLKALGRDPKPEGASPAPENAEGKEPAKAAATVTDENSEPDAAADGKLPFANHPRFKQVLSQRARFKADAEKHAQTLKDLEPKVRHFDSIVSFATESGWTQEYFQDLLHMGRLMNTDPISFYEAFKGQWSKIEEMVGAKLPADLQKQVTDGLLNPAAAKEVALLRTKSALSESNLRTINERNERSRQAAEKDRQQQEIETAINASGASASGWERQWKGSDPDYAKKQPHVKSRISEKLMPLLVEGKIPTQAEVLQICNDARKEVEAEMRAWLPPRGTIRTPNSGTTVDPKGEPANELAIARQALERAHAS